LNSKKTNQRESSFTRRVLAWAEFLWPIPPSWLDQIAGLNTPPSAQVGS